MKSKLIILILAFGLAAAMPGLGFCADAIEVSRTAAVPEVAAQEIKPLDINTATLQDLLSVRGIGPALAQKIIDYRQKNGPFKKIDDLTVIAGIGPVNLENFRQFLKVTPAK